MRRDGGVFAVIPANAGIHLRCLEWMSQKQPAVYIMASAERGTLYIGITGWLKHGVREHREGLVKGFTKAHSVGNLVWFESCRFCFRDCAGETLEEVESRMEIGIDRESQPSVARSMGRFDRMRSRMDSRVRAE